MVLQSAVYIEDAHFSSNVPGTQKSLKNNIIGNLI